ncbi:MAG: DUF433 domain-containing protein [Pseudomonadota bacterium]
MTIDAAHLRIVARPGLRSGEPIIEGTRIALHDVLTLMAAGMTTAENPEDYRQLSDDDIKACLAYAARMTGRTRVVAA